MDVLSNEARQRQARLSVAFETMAAEAYYDPRCNGAGPGARAFQAALIARESQATAPADILSAAVCVLRHVDETVLRPAAERGSRWRLVSDRSILDAIVVEALSFRKAAAKLRMSPGTLNERYNAILKDVEAECASYLSTERFPTYNIVEGKNRFGQNRLWREACGDETTPPRTVSRGPVENAATRKAIAEKRAAKIAALAKAPARSIVELAEAGSTNSFSRASDHGLGPDERIAAAVAHADQERVADLNYLARQSWIDQRHLAKSIAKVADRRDLERLTAEFLARGGKVTVCKTEKYVQGSAYCPTELQDQHNREVERDLGGDRVGRYISPAGDSGNVQRKAIDRIIASGSARDLVAAYTAQGIPVDDDGTNLKGDAGTAGVARDNDAPDDGASQLA